MRKICKVCNTMKEFRNNSRSLTCYDCLDNGYKYCSTCDTVKPTTDFRPSGNFGLKSKCIVCERAYNAAKSKELYAKSPERRQAIKDAVKVTRNTEQGRLKANEYSSKYYSTSEGKQQNREASQRWYSTPEGRLYAKNKSHNRRSIVEAGELTLEQWQQTLEFFGYACAYCTEETELTLDHIVALSKGGQHTISNIVPACKHCNSSKSAKDLEDWYKSKSYFSAINLQRIIEWRILHE